MNPTELSVICAKVVFQLDTVVSTTSRGRRESHQKRVQQQETSKSMQSFLWNPKHDSESDKVTAAEVTGVYHSVQHAHSYRPTDCSNKLASVIFLDSDIAKKMSCGRTKSACIVTQVLAPVSVEKYIRDLTSPILPGDKHKHTPFFSVASDASNHGSVKLFPLALRYWTPELA